MYFLKYPIVNACKKISNHMLDKDGHILSATRNQLQVKHLTKTCLDDPLSAKGIFGLLLCCIVKLQLHIGI